MDNNQSVQQFTDMVNATEKLTKPWKKLCAILVAAIVAVCLIWASIVFYLIHMAYTEVTYEFDVDAGQVQDYGNQYQENSSNVTVGSN